MGPSSSEVHSAHLFAALDTAVVDVGMFFFKAKDLTAGSREKQTK